MKPLHKIVTATVLLCLIASIKLLAQYSAGIEFQEDPEWGKVLKQAKKLDRLIFMDAYTSWCVPCKQMEKQVFSKAAEGDYFNRTFINVKYDMDRGEGARLKKMYSISGFPTYLFLNEEGDVVHRIFGAYMAEGVFMDYAKLAVTPGESTSDLEKRYKNGERNPRMMFSYLRALRLTGQQEREQQLSKEYLSLVTKDHYMDADYWQIIKFFIQNPISREFQILLENRDEIGEKIGKAEVDAKIFGVVNNWLQDPSPENTVPIDVNKEQLLIDFLREADFPRSQELLAKALALRHGRNGDWELYAAVVDAMLDFKLLKYNEEPLKELDQYAKVLGESTFDKNLLKRAFRWSDYASQKEKRPRVKEEFLQTKARLILKLGN